MKKNALMAGLCIRMKSFASLKAVTLLCLLMLFVAGAKAQTKTPYVIWCEGNGTMYFTYSTESYDSGQTYDGQMITDVWNANDFSEERLGYNEYFPPKETCVSVVIDESFQSFQPLNTAFWFAQLASLETIKGLEYLNTSNVTNMKSMFMGCSSLKNINVSNFNTSKVTDMSDMFDGCSELQFLNLTSFDVSNVTTMSSMFTGCSNLTTIYCTDDWSDKVGVQEFGSIFYGCTSLKGGNGTTYNSDNIGTSYARVDNADSPGYFSGLDLDSPVAYALWCEGDNTFYFLQSTKCYAPGFTYNGQVITNSWSGDDVVNTGINNPDWYSSDIVSKCQRVVFDESFSNVRPNSLYRWFYFFEKLSSIENLKYLVTDNVEDFTQSFASCKSLESLDIEDLHITEKAKYLVGMFLDCSSLKSLDLSGFNTKNVTEMSTMFSGCTSLESVNLSGFDVTNVERMPFMFQNCSSLTTLDLSSFGSSKVFELKGMFSGCSSLKTIDLSNFNPYQVSSTNSMFENCSSLTTLKLGKFVASENASLRSMFEGCSSLTSLDLSFLDTAKVRYMSKMFFGCSELIDINLSNFNTSNVVDMSGMFQDCTKLESLDLSGFDVSKVEKMSNMFSECKSLTTIYCNDDWSDKTGEDFTNLFSGCTSLKGGYSTSYNSEKTGTSYAHVDNVYSPGYFTGVDWNSPVDYVLWCEGDNTIYFLQSTKYYAPGYTYNGQVITYTWSGDDVVNTEYSIPKWSWSCSDMCQRVVFDESFSNVRPNSLYHWFYFFEKLSSIENLKYLVTDNVVDMYDMFCCCTSLESVDLSGFDVTNVKRMDGMFESCSSLTSLDLSSFGSSKVSTMMAMFSGCSSLKTIDLSNFNPYQVSNASSMFANCSSLTTLKLGRFVAREGAALCNMFEGCSSLTSLDLSFFDTTNVTDMAHMFDGCSSLTSLDLSNFNTSNVKDMRYMFHGCTKLESLDLSSFDVSKVYAMMAMFSGCASLTNLDLSNFNTTNVSYMYEMFEGCRQLKELDVSHFNTEKVYKMASMFKDCASLKKIDLSQFVTGKVENMSQMFSGCINLETLDLRRFDTSNVTDMHEMYSYCTKLENLILDNFNTSKVENMSKMFEGCRQLTTIYCNNDWNSSSVKESMNMFYSCSNLCGSNGTQYSDNKVDVEFARLDGEGHPGYFSKYAPTMDLTITDAMVGTLYLEFPAIIPDEDYFDVYYVKSIDEDGTIYLKKVKDIIPSYMGVIVFGNKGTYSLTMAETYVEPASENKLRGVYEETSVDYLKDLNGTDIYILSRGKDKGSYIDFYKAGGSIKSIPAHRAYLPYTVSNDVKALTISFDEEPTTGIYNIVDRDNIGKSEIYNLAGQRVTTPSHGVYIMNGKKVLMR